MKYRSLGNTGLTVSEVGFGTWAIGGLDWGRVDDRESVTSVHCAMDLGVNFFDTANVYGEGHSETILGRALKGRRDQAVIATKGGMQPGRGSLDFSASSLDQALTGSLQRLGTDYVDLYQLHNPDMEVIRRGDVFETLEGFRRAGKIRAWGVSLRPPSSHWKVPASGASNDPVGDGLELLSLVTPTSLQLVFNIFERDPAARLFTAAEHAGVSLLARVPLASGLLSGKFTPDTVFPDDDFRKKWPRDLFLEDLKRVDRLKQIFQGSEMSLTQGALAFTLSFSAVTLTIAGAKNARQVEENAGASSFAPLSADRLSEIARVLE